MEKCFLVDALTKKGQQSEAQKIADNIKLMKDAYETYEVTEHNRIFDIVLNLNMLKAAQGGDDLLGGLGNNFGN